MVPWISSLSTLPDSSWFYWKFLFLKLKPFKFPRMESWKSIRAELLKGSMFCRLDFVKVFQSIQDFLKPVSKSNFLRSGQEQTKCWFAESQRQKQQDSKCACLHEIGSRLNHQQFQLGLGNKLSSEVLGSHSQ